MSYPSLNEQLKMFPVYRISGRQLVRDYSIKTDKDYNHFEEELHHYIRKQMYFRNPQRYEGQEKLIRMSIEMHKDLHSAMSDARFYNKWKVERDLLLYRHRKVENEEI